MSTTDTVPWRLKKALIAALDPRGDVSRVFVSELQAALPWMTKEKAEESVADILFRRRGEQRAAVGEGPSLPMDLRLTPDRQQDLVKTFVQPQTGLTEPTAESLLHIHANLNAQHALHEMLAKKVFSPGGRLEQALAESMHRHQPMVLLEDIQKTAADYIKVRRARAEEVTEALKPGGSVEKQAIEMASDLRRRSDADVSKAKNPIEIEKKKLGEDIAFGIQQTIACWATDFIDPYVGTKIQKKMEPHIPTEHHHAWAGEIAGDTAAFFSFLAVRKFFPQSIEWIKRGAETIFDRFYEKSGRKSLKQWAVDHHTNENSTAYQKKLAEWKDFQADNFAKSSVITISSIVFNVIAQRTMTHNKHSLLAITTAKLAGAAITMAGMLGVRLAIPDSTQRLDDELNERYFNPLIEKTQRVFGVDREAMGPHTRRVLRPPPPAMQIH